MNVEIIKATIEQKPILANLLEIYTYELCRTTLKPFDIGDNGFYGYKYLPLYWNDSNRFPYLIYIDKKIAGFVLIWKGSPIATDSQDVWDIAEFWIMHKYQRQRFGTKVAHTVWGQFKGNWQVRVLVDNQPANLFWLQAIDLFTNGSFKTTTMTIEKDLWIIYKFESIGC